MAVDDTRRFLAQHPMATALVYVTTGILPLYLTSAQILSLDADLGFNPGRLGLATAAYFGAAALFAPVAGRYVRAEGAKAGLRMGATLAGVGSVVGAITPVWWIIPLATAVAGVANAFMQVGTNILLVRIAASHRQAISFGTKQAAVPLASSLAGILLPAIGILIGWRWSFVLAALIAVIVRSIVPEVPHQTTTNELTARAERSRIPRPLMYLAIAGACGGAAGNAISLFLVPAAVDTGLSEGMAGTLLAIGSALVVAVRVGSGWSVDRRRTSGHTEMAALLAMGVVGCVFLAMSAGIPFYIPAVIVAMLGAWGWPGLVYYTVTSTNPDQPARASGVVLAGNLTGTLIGPFVVGLLADRGMYPAAWTFCGILSGVGAISMLMSRSSWRNSIEGTGRTHHPAGDLAKGTTCQERT